MKKPEHKYDPAIHHRRSIRLRGHDYAARGVYFVTICVAKNRPLFGVVVNGQMVLNDAGRIAAACWRDIPKHFPQVALDEWVVMPDHVHGIITIRRDGDSAGANAGAKDFSPLPPRPCGTSRTIGSIVRGFKIGVTKLLDGDSPWQRNYYDIIVRDARALNNIRAYIRNNPVNLDVLRYGEPRFFEGNQALLEMPMTAFLASRGGRGERFFARTLGERFFAPTFAPAYWPERPACVVGGFLSPMERAVFDACLADDIPTVQLLARGLPNMFPPHMRRAIDNGRCLIATPFDASVDRFSAARAAWCNQYTLHLSRNIMIGQLSTDGMLACLLSDLPENKPITFLKK